MTFSRIDSAIAAARKHLAAISGLDPQLEAFIVGYLVLEVICEFEVRIEAMFFLRAQKAADSHLANFVKRQLDRKFRSPELSKINELLKAFDTGVRDAFNNAIQGTRIPTAWHNLITNRHYYVHKQGSATMAFTDLTNDYAEASQLFDHLATALGLSAADVSSFS